MRDSLFLSNVIDVIWGMVRIAHGGAIDLCFLKRKAQRTHSFYEEKGWE